MKRHGQQLGALAALATVMALTVGCGAEAATEQEYAAARTALDASLGTAKESGAEISDGEIDCMAKARDSSVAELATEVGDSSRNPLSAVDVAKIFACLSPATYRSMMEARLGTKEAAAASGVDRDCVADLLTEQFEQWKAAGASVDDMNMMSASASSSDADKCVTATATTGG